MSDGVRAMHDMKALGEEQKEGEKAPLSPWKGPLEQGWDRIYEETHAGGGGDVLKELRPTLEQRRSRRGRTSNPCVPAGMGSRLRHRRV